MEYNPFAERCVNLQQKIAGLEASAARCKADIAWYEKFDSEAAFAQLNTLRRALQASERQRAQLKAESAPVDASVKTLEALTSFSFDPRQWFSDERKENKRRLAVQRGMQSQQQKALTAIDEQIKKTAKKLEDVNAEQERHRRFDCLKEVATYEGQLAQIARLRPLLAQALTDKKRVDAKLTEPLASLAECQAREKLLASELAQATELENQLSKAQSSYERHLLHEKSSNIFGEGRPGRVMRQKQTELDGVRRSIEKLKARLRAIGQAASRVVRTVVIDGNNLCYEQDRRRMIGLGALEAAARRLARDYKVVIVFDAGICSVCKLTPQAISARFSNVAEIHIVPSKAGADETILDAAGDVDAYVLSNDKFRDFPDKAVVRAGRLVTHSIVNRRIMIHDLDVNESFISSETERAL